MGLAFAGMLMASCADSPTAVADYQVVIISQTVRQK